MLGLSGGLLTGQGDVGQGGLGQALQHIMQQGLVGQVPIGDTINQNIGFGQDLQNRALGQMPGGPGSLQGNLLSGQGPQSAAPLINTPGLNDPAVFQNILQQALDPLGGGIQTPLIGNLPQAQAPQIGAPGIQSDVQNQLQQMLSQGGLSDDFIQAQTERVLKPAQERLTEQINKRSGGGEIDLNSGIFLQSQRELEENFANQLTETGFQNMQQTLGQGMNFGQQQFGQGFANAQLGTQTNQQNIDRLLQTSLANQQAGLQTQNLGVEAGLSGLGIGTEVGSILAGLEQARGNMGLQSSLANQGALQGASQFDIGALLQSQGLGGDLQNQLFNQQLQGAGMTNQIGEQAFNRGLSAFGAIPQNVLPFMQLSSDVGQGQQQAALNQFNSIGTQGQNLINNISNLTMKPMELWNNITLGQQGANTDAASTLFQGQDIFNQGFLGQQGQGIDLMQFLGQLGLGQTAFGADAMNNILRGKFGVEAAEAGQPGVGASIIGGIIDSAPDWIDLFFNRGEGQKSFPGTPPWVPRGFG
jgi:hypothetical protein